MPSRREFWSFVLKDFLPVIGAVATAIWFLSSEIGKRPTTDEVKTIISETVTGQLNEFKLELTEKSFGPLTEKVVRIQDKLNEIAHQVGIPRLQFSALMESLKKKDTKMRNLENKFSELAHESMARGIEIATLQDSLKKTGSRVVLQLSSRLEESLNRVNNLKTENRKLTEEIKDLEPEAKWGRDFMSALSGLEYKLEKIDPSQTDEIQGVLDSYYWLATQMKKQGYHDWADMFASEYVAFYRGHPEFKPDMLKFEEMEKLGRMPPVTEK